MNYTRQIPPFEKTNKIENSKTGGTPRAFKNIPICFIVQKTTKTEKGRFKKFLVIIFLKSLTGFDNNVII